MLHCHSVMWQGRVSTRMSVVSVCAQTPMDLCAHRHTYMSTGIHIRVPTWTTKTSTWINIYTPCSHTNNSACILTHVRVYSHTCACSTYTYACACSQIHTHLPMCTYIHTLCISFPLFKSQAPYEHLRCPCFPLFLRAKLSAFITHFSIFAAAMPAHTRNIFCARNACSDELSLPTYTLQCEREAIDSFFYSAWEFLGS